MKVYKSREGLLFSISPTNRPAEGEVVYWTVAEWDYIKTQSLTPELFRIIYNLKKDDYLYCPIPEKEITVAAKLALEFGGQIIEQLKRGKKSEL